MRFWFLGSILSFSFFLLLAGCQSVSNKNRNASCDTTSLLSDNKATLSTKYLYKNLYQLSSKAILFGQQNATANGVGWKNEDLRSDVFDVCGSYPALYGWNITPIDSLTNSDTILYDRLKFWIKSAFSRGGTNVITWEPSFPGSNSNIYNKPFSINDILPNGKYNNLYNNQLDFIANFFFDLKDKNGDFIPVFFRPFPNCNTPWFWWGNKAIDSQDFVNLWRYTVTYLRDKKNIHNLIYIFSPYRFISKENYLERFPGTEYVDVLGVNDYYDFSSLETVPAGISQLQIIAQLAQSMNKICALTETGLKGLAVKDWWTKNVLYPIKNDSLAKRISWIMTWQNTSATNFYVPYPGHASVSNFIQFESDSFTYFQDDLPDLYSNKHQ
jgi:mannan endo-1,4-beta-mannosidase